MIAVAGYINYSENWEANRQQRERTINERASSPKCILQTS